MEINKSQNYKTVLKHLKQNISKELFSYNYL